jgi:hypothetical protein
MRNLINSLLGYMTLFTTEVKQYRTVIQYSLAINYPTFWKAYNLLLERTWKSFVLQSSYLIFKFFSMCVCKFVQFLLMLWLADEHFYGSAYRSLIYHKIISHCTSFFTCGPQVCARLATWHMSQLQTFSSSMHGGISWFLFLPTFDSFYALLSFSRGVFYHSEADRNFVMHLRESSNAGHLCCWELYEVSR